MKEETMNTDDLKLIEESAGLLRNDGWTRTSKGLERLIERLRKELEGKDTPEPTEADLRASYLEGQAKCGLKVGDRVRVTRRAETLEAGWDHVWIPHMEEAVGKVGTITKDGGERGFLIDSRCYFPYFVLDKVEKKRLPLEMKDWAGGPWWVRWNGTNTADMVIGLSTIGCSVKAGFIYAKDAIETHERSTDLEKWEPCYKEAEQ